jgi:hypothetical protein
MSQWKHKSETHQILGSQVLYSTSNFHTSWGFSSLLVHRWPIESRRHRWPAWPIGILMLWCGAAASVLRLQGAAGVLLLLCRAIAVGIKLWCWAVAAWRLCHWRPVCGWSTTYRSITCSPKMKNLACNLPQCNQSIARSLYHVNLPVSETRIIVAKEHNRRYDC